jgi:hypothetical protein
LVHGGAVDLVLSGQTSRELVTDEVGKRPGLLCVPLLSSGLHSNLRVGNVTKARQHTVLFLNVLVTDLQNWSHLDAYLIQKVSQVATPISYPRSTSVDAPSQPRLPPVEIMNRHAGSKYS